MMWLILWLIAGQTENSKHFFLIISLFITKIMNNKNEMEINDSDSSSDCSKQCIKCRF